MKNKEIYQKDRKTQGIEKPEKGMEKKEKISKNELTKLPLLEEEILNLEKKLSEKKKEKEKETKEHTSKEKIKNDKGTEGEAIVVDSALRSPSLPNDVLTDEEKVENLIKIVFKQGLKKAIEEAKSLNNAYILDEFHDRLIERLKELEKK